MKADKIRENDSAELQTKLLEQQGLIPLLPPFLHSAVHRSVHNEAIECHRLARRRRRAERAHMCAAGSPPKRHAVPLNQLIFQGEVNIGKRPQQPSNHLFPRTDAADRFRHAGQVDDTVGRERDVRRRDVAAIEALQPHTLILYGRFDRHFDLQARDRVFQR